MIFGPERQVLAVGRLHYNSSAEAQVRFMAVVPEAHGRGLGGVRSCGNWNTGRMWRARLRLCSTPVRMGSDASNQNHGFVVIGPAPTMFDVVKRVQMSKDL